jgi:hypothetical protein
MFKILISNLKPTLLLSLRALFAALRETGFSPEEKPFPFSGWTLG